MKQISFFNNRRLGIVVSCLKTRKKYTDYVRIGVGDGHVAFTAPSKAAVFGFYDAARAAGARSYIAPGEHDGSPHCVSAAVLDRDGNSIEAVYHSAELYEGSLVRGTRLLTAGNNSKSVVSTRNSAAKSAISDSTITTSMARRLQAGGLSSRSTSAPSVPSVSRAATEVSASNVLETLQRSLIGGMSGSASLLLGDSKIQMSAKAFTGTLLGAAAGAAMAYAMYKSEEDSAREEEIASIAAHRQQLLSGNQATPLPRTPSNTPATSLISRGSRKTGMRALEAGQLIPSNSYALTGYPRVEPIDSNAFTNRSNIPLSQTRPSVRSARRVAPSIYEGSTTQNPLHNLVTKDNSRSASKLCSQTRSVVGSRAPSEHSNRSSASKKTDKRHTSKRSTAPSRSLSHILEEELPPLPPGGQSVYDDDLGSVMPTDSISNAGSRTRSRNSRHLKEKKPSSTSKSESKRASRRQEGGSKKRSKSEAGKTETPGRYKGRSVINLPIR
jgi:hypothetical protein